MTIKFIYPYLLLLLIPVVIGLGFLFFKTEKRFRLSKKRITIFSLTFIVLAISIIMISNLKIGYKNYNKINEIILLVDYSDSNILKEKENELKVKKILDLNENKYKIGIVKFGYDCIYAAKLNSDMREVYKEFLNSKKPNKSATNIEKAIDYSSNLFTNKENAKIVLLSDLIETDGNMQNALTRAKTNNVDVEVLKNKILLSENDVAIKNIFIQSETLETNKDIPIKVNISSNVDKSIILKLYNDNEEIYSNVVPLKSGDTTITVNHKFKNKGLNKIRAEIDSSDDDIKENNKMFSYVNIDDVNRVLIIEKYENESKYLKDILKEKDKVNVINKNNLPTTLEYLSNYDQIILFNISNSDINNNFVSLLEQYLTQLNGSLLTIGGFIQDGSSDYIQNTYNHSDMKDTEYEKLLPIISETYTPPIAVLIVLDTSASMSKKAPNGQTYMHIARESAKSSIASLNDRDYVGIVTFANEAKVQLDLTLVSNKLDIYTKINKMTTMMGGTVYSNGLEKAIIMLKSIKNVSKKHIIFISDGDPGDSQTVINSKIENAKENSISISTISFVESVYRLEDMAKKSNGKYYEAKDYNELLQALKDDFNNDEIREFEKKDFKLKKGYANDIFNELDENDLPIANGFFGTKLKENANQILVGEYNQPIYAQWKYKKKGKVSSLMIDLNKYFSKDILETEKGKQLILNLVNNNFPLNNVKNKEVEIETENQNYKNLITIFTNENKDEKVILTIYDEENNNKILTKEITQKNKETDIEILKPGIYKFEVKKLNNENVEIYEQKIYKTLKYSDEYNFIDNISDINEKSEKNSKLFNKNLSSEKETFSNITNYNYKEFDTRIVLSVLAIILILLIVFINRIDFKSKKKIKKSR